MSSGMELRKRGKRKDPETQASKKQRGRLGDPLNAIDAGSPGEIRISSDNMIAISHLYNSSPSIQAARAILMGQLLGSGVVVRRQGRVVGFASWHVLEADVKSASGGDMTLSGAFCNYAAIEKDACSLVELYDAQLHQMAATGVDVMMCLDVGEWEDR